MFISSSSSWNILKPSEGISENIYNIAVAPDGDRLMVKKFRKIFFESYYHLIMLKCCKIDMVKLCLHQMYFRELIAFYINKS